VTYNLNTRSSCQSGTGSPTTCQVTLINQASSSGSFTWAASSDPQAALVEPNSGVVAKGGAEKVTVTVPSGSPCPVKVTFASISSDASVTVTVTTVDGAQCSS
jgi:hypothetical protein